MLINPIIKEVTYAVDRTKLKSHSDIGFICNENVIRIKQDNDRVAIHTYSLDAFIEILQELKQELIKEGLIKEENENE